MTKEKLWKIYVRKNPSFDGAGSVTLSAKGLRKMFDTTWDIAYFDGEEEIDRDINYNPSSASVNDLMKMFGMK
jgi:hypothetical protein